MTTLNTYNLKSSMMFLSASLVSRTKKTCQSRLHTGRLLIMISDWLGYSVFCIAMNLPKIILKELPSSGVTLISGVTLFTWGDFDLSQKTTTNCKIRCPCNITLYLELCVVAWSRD